MPSILNLKFKGNKSFVAFSNLNDVDSLTKTWKVCTKVASYLEQGQRLENLSWRLWHLQNLMVDTDNAKSKREFKKLSKHMSDKLDKEKGRSIEELEAPDFRRNHSSDMIRQKAVEKERSREASQNAQPGTIKRMQFTFSVDQPTAPATAQAVKKPDLKPSPEFNKRFTVRSSPKSAADADEHMDSVDVERFDDLGEEDDGEGDDQPLTQRGRKDNDLTLRFPPLFSSDFGPAALLNPSPTLTTSMNYGEGLNAPNSANDNDGFSIPRPTIELPLDELLNGVDSPRSWSPAFFNDKNVTNTPSLFSTTSLVNTTISNSSESPVFYLPNTSNNHDDDDDVVMQSVPITTVSGNSFGGAFGAPFGSFDTSDAEDSSVSDEESQATSDSVDLISTTTTTISSVSSAKPTLKSISAPSKLKLNKARSTTPRPNLTVRTSTNSPNTGGLASASATSAVASISRSNASVPPVSGNSTTPTPFTSKPPLKSAGASFKAGRGTAATMNNLNNVPGGQKAECSNCGATHTPLWRRGLNDELNCNACGLYCKLHKRPRPKTMRNQHGEGRSSNSAPRPETVEVMAQCYNCHTTATPLWRKDDEGKTVCNACGLYYKLHGSARPISMKSDVIRKRSRHDVRARANSTGGAGRGFAASDTPSASPGVSRRPSPSPGPTFRDTSPGISFSNDLTNPNASPILAPDSSTAPNNIFDYSSGNTSDDNMDLEYPPSNSQSELMGALGGESGNGNASPNSQHGSSDNGNSSSPASNNSGNTNPSFYSNLFNIQFPGPYHPDHLSQYSSYSSLSTTPLDALPFSSGDYESELRVDLSMSPRTNKRRRMSSDSASEPPSSAVSFSSFADSYGSSSSRSHSQQSSIGSMSSISAIASEFPFSNAFSHISNLNANALSSGMGGQSQIFRGPNAFWHPPMMLPSSNSNSALNDASSSTSTSTLPLLHHSYNMSLHPPMLPSMDDSHMDSHMDAPMDYLHPPMLLSHHHHHHQQQPETSHHDDEILFSTYMHPPMSLPLDDNTPSPRSNGSGETGAIGNNDRGSKFAGKGSETRPGSSGSRKASYYGVQEYGLNMRIY
ncbi:hypothetical protein D9757_011712 [Collybiopsis confluens]|uniref:GATA-type domain-containing protein n=1 Tax=Collybiopsis confluens TaxID=2823264 RepID=A0A8H5LMY5_9AGAR|nr:hypothetical protein D9757_011712 [Collybiopsis confluens]